MSIHLVHKLDRSALSAECIADCCTPGKDRAARISRWRLELDFTVDRVNAVHFLSQYSAWSTERLSTMTDAEVADDILWNAACCFFCHEPVFIMRAPNG